MPPKKKTVSKVKGKKVQNPTPTPSGPLPTAADEKLVVSTTNEEGSSTKEVITPLVTSVEEKVNMLEDSEAETLKVVEMEEHEGTKEADSKDSEDSKPREDMAEELNGGEPASTVVSLEEVRAVNGETKLEAEDPIGKPDVEGNKQTDQDETCEDDFESVSGDDEENDDEEGNNDNNLSVHTQSSLPENKKKKEFELHIGGLGRGASEEDLTKVFGVFGEIESIRIARHPVTQKSKGYAFIRYVCFDHTQKALAELKDGAEVKGKKVRVSASQNNTTLYIENLCKNWTKERILGTLKDYGVEQIEEIILPDDPNEDGNNKGHVFVEFKSHADAMTAFQRLQKPDAVFGLDTSVKVSFSQPLIHPSKEDSLKVTTVYLEGLPKVWDLSKIQEICKQYGEIVRTKLLNLRRKKCIICFVEFSGRDSAVACVDGFNSTQFEGNINVKASFAKPLSKGRVSKQPKGGFKLQKDEDTKSANKKPSVSKKNNGKGKTIHKKEERISNNGVNKATSSSQYEYLKEKKNHETHQSAKRNKRGRKDTNVAHEHEPFKKARSDHKFNSRSSYSSNPHSPRQAQYDSVKRSRAPHTRTSASQYSKAPLYTRKSVSRYSSNDLAPHAGLLPPASQARNHHAYDESASQARNHHAYDERSRSDTYRSQPASSSGAYYLQPASSYGAPRLQPTSGYGASHLQPTSSSVHLQASTSAYAGAAPPVVRSSYPGYSSYPPGSYQVYPSSGTYNYPRSYY